MTDQQNRRLSITLSHTAVKEAVELYLAEEGIDITHHPTEGELIHDSDGNPFLRIWIGEIPGQQELDLEETEEPQEPAVLFS